MKVKEEKISKIEVIGRLLTQEITGKNLVVLSEECLACVLNLSDPENSSYNYSLYIKNQDVNVKSKNSTWSNLSFQLNPVMELSQFNNKDIDVFQWCTKTNIYFLELLVDEMNERNISNFQKILEQCLRSVSQKIPFNMAGIQRRKSSKRYIVDLGEINNIEKHVEFVLKNLEEKKKKEELEKELIKQMKDMQLAQTKVDDIINTKVVKKVFEAQGEIFNFDDAKNDLVNLNDKDTKVLIKIYKLDSQKFDFALTVETLDRYLISIDKIRDEITGQMADSKDSKFFCWITNKCYRKTVGDCLGFLFNDIKESLDFFNIFNKCKWETKNKQSYETIEENNRIYLQKSRNNEKIDCFSDSEDEKKEKDEEKEKEEEKEKPRKRRKKNRENLMDLDDKYSQVESPSKTVLNKFCIDALTNDRTFCVTDDNQIVVYKANMSDDTIEKLSSLPVIQEYQGKSVKLNKGLLYKSESNMLLLDQNNPYVLYQYDLPKGKIVSEWKTDKTTISDICSLKRDGQKTDEQVIYGVNPKSVFTLDERVNNKYNIGEIKSYQTKNFANKIMSTQGGQFITGGERGDLRFYDRIGIKAKNLFSFYGDPIRHIDISSDDQYLLITCDKYLLLVNNLSNKNDQNAFLTTIPLEERRIPLTLQVKTSDIAKYGLKDANFTPARFDVNEDGLNNIITSLGEYIIIWNYNDIRKKKLNYKIKKADDLVIDNYFKSGKRNKIIIGMPTKIRIQNLKKIK